MLYTYKATCKRVIDGDTFTLKDVDLGFSTFIKDMTVRLNRIDAPETRTKDKEEKEAGLKATEYLKPLEGKELIIQTQKADSFGRYLAEVWYNGDNINDRLVKEELAVYKSY